MRCNFEILCAYLDNQLDETQKNEVVTHLHRCDICREAVSLICEDRGVQDDALRVSNVEGTGPLAHAETAGKAG